MNRRCPRCGEVKPPTEFGSDASQPSGKASRCKRCDRAKSKAYYDNRPPCACGKPQHAKGKCHGCYSAWYREQNPDKVERYNRYRLRGPIPCVECGVLHNRQKLCAECAADRIKAARKERDRKASRTRRVTAEQNRIKYMKRRAAKRLTDITPEWLADLRAAAKKCPLCTTALTTRPGQPNSRHVDHIVPIAAGGTHTMDNLRVICAACNLARPHDGSDLVGQPLTLCQIDANAAPNVVDLDARRQPDHEARRRAMAAKEFARWQSRHARAETGRLIARVRASGAQWDEAAAFTSNDAPGSAYALADASCSVPIGPRSWKRRAS